MKLNLLILSIFLASASCFSQKGTTYELLQGKWQSTDDQTNFLWFDKNHRKETVVGMDKWDVEIFVISNSCKNDSDKDRELPKEKDKYISITGSDLCWYIVELTPKKLVLSYIGRGNTLTYRKVSSRSAR